jgi:hypothetical protein
VELVARAGIGPFDPDSYRVSVADLREPLQMAGLRDVRAETVTLDAR